MNNTIRLVDLINDKIADWIFKGYSMSDIGCPAPKSANKGKVKEIVENIFKLLPPDMDEWVKNPDWNDKLCGRKEGTGSWKLRKAKLADFKPNSEVCFQHHVATNGHSWYPELAVGSGIGAGKRTAIDLVKELGNNRYRFIELKTKIKTNNAIYATAELMRYALFYALCRNNYKELSATSLASASSDVFEAEEIVFQVCAPDSYYNATFINTLGTNKGKSAAKVFQNTVSKGFHKLGRSLNMKMCFEFRKFDSDIANIAPHYQALDDAALYI